MINTYEYTAEGVTRQIDNLQSVPLSVIAVWMDKFENGQVYYIADAEQEKGYPTYEMLVEQNIKRLLTVPLKKTVKSQVLLVWTIQRFILMMRPYYYLSSILL